MHKILGSYKFPKLSQKEVNKLNIKITNREIEIVIKILLTKIRNRDL